MKIFVIIAALFSTGMSIDVATNTQIPPILNNGMSKEEYEMTAAKVRNDEITIILTYYNFLNTLMEKLNKKNSLESLDKIIDNTCLPTIDEEQLYTALVRVNQITFGKEDPFTEEEKPIVKSKLERIFCNIVVKMSAIATFSRDCFTNLIQSDLRQDISECVRSINLDSSRPLRDILFFSPEMCKFEPEVTNCFDKVTHGKCSSKISEKVKLAVHEAFSIMGCVS